MDFRCLPRLFVGDQGCSAGRCQPHGPGGPGAGVTSADHTHGGVCTRRCLLLLRNTSSKGAKAPRRSCLGPVPAESTMGQAQHEGIVLRKALSPQGGIWQLLWKKEKQNH